MIRLAAIIVFLAVSGVAYLQFNEGNPSWERILSYVLGGIALVAFIYYLIQMRQFRGTLNEYFNRKKMEP